jgi:hypothetical protein
MRITYQTLAMGCASLLVLGCVEKADPTDTTSESAETTETAAEPTTAGTQNETSASATDTEPPSSDTDTTNSTEPPSSDTDTTSEPGATDPAETESATEPASSESDTDSETDTDTGMAFPEECVEVDPDVTATFSVDIDWPEASNDFHFIDVTCTIDAMTEDAGSFEHALTCDDAGTPRPLTLKVAESAVGPVVWAEGEAVRLSTSRHLDDEFAQHQRSVRMWAADEALLMVGYEGHADSAPEFAPLTFAVQFPCGEENIDGEPGLPFELVFGLAGASVAVAHGQRGVLPIDGSAAFAVDVGEATTNYCCHYTREYHALIRRVAPL